MKAAQLTVTILVCVGCMTLQSPTFAQQATSVEAAQTQAVTPLMRREANDLYQNKDWAKAIAAYETIVKIEPSNAGALNRLGASLHSMGNYDRAIETYKRAVEISPQPATMYNLACSYARLKNSVQAFEWLDRSIKAGYNQPDAMRADDDLAGLRGDARFSDLLARAAVNAKPCSANPLNRQFDFWVGEWQVENPQGQLAGTSTIQLILGDCVVFENWTSSSGTSGKSFNFYNSKLQKWQQTWVDDRGGVQEFFGEYKDGQLRYMGESPAPNGGKTWQRMTFFNLSKDRVRQLWEQSTDGKSWTVSFDGTYVRNK